MSAAESVLSAVSRAGATLQGMTEVPVPLAQPGFVPASPPQPSAPQQPSRLYQVAAWVVIVAGVVFIAAVLFWSGVVVAGQHNCHHSDYYQGPHGMFGTYGPPDGPPSPEDGRPPFPFSLPFPGGPGFPGFPGGSGPGMGADMGPGMGPGGPGPSAPPAVLPARP